MNRGATTDEMAEVISALEEALTETAHRSERERLAVALAVWRRAAQGISAPHLKPVDRPGSPGVPEHPRDSEN